METQIFLWDTKKQNYIQILNGKINSDKLFKHIDGTYTKQIFLDSVDFNEFIKDMDKFIEETRQFIKDLDKFLEIKDDRTKNYLIKNTLYDFQDDNFEVLEK